MFGIIKAIDEALQTGSLKQPFRSSDFKFTCPGFAEKTYSTFLAKHSLGNPGKNTQYFVRVGRGLYKRIS